MAQRGWGSTIFDSLTLLLFTEVARKSEGPLIRKCVFMWKFRTQPYSYANPDPNP